MLGLPAVGQCQADASGAQPVSLQRNCIVEQFAHNANAHVLTPTLFLGVRLSDQLGDPVVGPPALHPIRPASTWRRHIDTDDTDATREAVARAPQRNRTE